MPFIHIKSLPFEQPFDVANAVEDISKDFAQAMGIGIEHITTTWLFLQPGHYAWAGKAVQYQAKESHPVLVDVVAPDFNAPETVARMLHTVAASLADRTGVRIDNIFVHYQAARSGEVFDAGAIVRW